MRKVLPYITYLGGASIFGTLGKKNWRVKKRVKARVKVFVIPPDMTYVPPLALLEEGRAAKIVPRRSFLSFKPPLSPLAGCAQSLSWYLHRIFHIHMFSTQITCFFTIIGLFLYLTFLILPSPDSVMTHFSRYDLNCTNFKNNHCWTEGDWDY